MPDNISKKLNIASRAVDVATSLFDSVDILMELSDQYIAMGDNFQDSDFVGSDLKHLDAYTIGALLANVATAINATIQDAGNGGFNKSILLKVRR